MSAIESSEDIGAALAKRSGWRSTPWIAAVGHRLHLQLCAVHGWATSLDGIASPSLYHIATAALGQLLVLANSAINSAMKRGCGKAAAAFGSMLANSRTHPANVQAAIVARSKSRNRRNNEEKPQ